MWVHCSKIPLYVLYIRITTSRRYSCELCVKSNANYAEISSNIEEDLKCEEEILQRKHDPKDNPNIQVLTPAEGEQTAESGHPNPKQGTVGTHEPA